MDKESRLLLVAKIRENVLDVCDDDEFRKSDGYLGRWLHYQHNDVDRASAAFKNCISWKKENNIEAVLEEDFTDFEVRFPMIYEEPDKFGRPVIRFMMESWDSAGFRFGEKEDRRTLRASFRLAEEVEAHIKKHSKGMIGEMSQCVMVVDCTKFPEHVKNIGLKNIYGAIRLMKESVSVLSTKYPRAFAAVYVLNASKWFTIFFTAVKPFISKATISVLQIHSAGSSKGFDWRSQIY